MHTAIPQTTWKIPDYESAMLVYRDGVLDVVASDAIPEGLSVEKNGAQIVVAANTIVRPALHIVHDGTSTITLTMGKGAQVRLVETWLRGSATLTNTNKTAAPQNMLQIALEDKAHLTHTRLWQHASQSGEAHDTVTVGKDAVYVSHAYSLDAKDIAHHLSVHIAGSGACAKLFGLYTPNHTSRMAHFPSVYHEAPGSASEQMYRGILGDEAHATFNGLIHVAHAAQQTNAKQSDKNILLTDHAQLFAKPELRIYADDVQCTHGATSGQLDAQALFYLQSRGIAAADARHLLTLSFASPLLAAHDDVALRVWLQHLVHERLATITVTHE